MTVVAYKPKISENAIDVHEAGDRPRKGRLGFDLGRDLEFSTEALRSYAYAAWEPVIYDAMVVAAALYGTGHQGQRAGQQRLGARHRVFLVAVHVDSGRHVGGAEQNQQRLLI